MKPTPSLGKNLLPGEIGLVTRKYWLLSLVSLVTTSKILRSTHLHQLLWALASCPNPTRNRQVGNHCRPLVVPARWWLSSMSMMISGMIIIKTEDTSAVGGRQKSRRLIWEQDLPQDSSSRSNGAPRLLCKTGSCANNRHHHHCCHHHWPVTVDEAPLNDVPEEHCFSLYWPHHSVIVCHTCLIMIVIIMIIT